MSRALGVARQPNIGQGMHQHTPEMSFLSADPARVHNVLPSPSHSVHRSPGWVDLGAGPDGAGTTQPSANPPGQVSSSASDLNNAPHSGPAPPPAESIVKVTRGHSCVLCQKRKVRCDKTKPCSNCVKAGVECHVEPPLPPNRSRGAKKTLQRDLINRLKRYESLLAQHGVAFDAMAKDLRPSSIVAGDDVDELEKNLGSLKTSPRENTLLSDDLDPASHHRDYAQELLDESSEDDEHEGHTIHHAFDKMFNNHDGFPFVIGGERVVANLARKHPEPMQMLGLWQIYLDNINPLLKITHFLSLQSQIIEAGKDLAKISKPFEALLFSIYLIAVTSMQDDEVQITFGAEKGVLVSRYHAATQQALINAGFMRSPDIMVLQAYILYLLSVRQYVDPRSLYCLIGIAVRMAQRLGIHRDGAQFGLPPFESEMRRRLWWVLLIFDRRIAQITGSTVTALTSSNSDCNWPLNINDGDLHVHAKDSPPTHSGPTEVFFLLTRIELVMAAPAGGQGPAYTTVSSGSSPKTPQSTGGSRPRFQFSPSPSVPDVVSNAASLNLPIHDLDGFCRYMDETYLRQCDRKIPLHLFTYLFTKQALCLLRVISYLRRTAAGLAGDLTERNALFAEAIRIVDYDNAIYAAGELKGFLWYSHMYFPLPGYMLLAHELKVRRTGDMVERAWDSIVENHSRRGLMRNLKSPVHVALGHVFVKAWDGRMAAEARRGKTLSTPEFIHMLRQTLGKLTGKPPPAEPKLENLRPSAANIGQRQLHGSVQHDPQARLNFAEPSIQQNTFQQHEHPHHQQQQTHPLQFVPPMTSSEDAAGVSAAVSLDDPGIYSGFDDMNQFHDSQQSDDQMDFTPMDMDWISMMPEIANFMMPPANGMYHPMVGGMGIGGGGGAYGAPMFQHPTTQAGNPMPTQPHEQHHHHHQQQQMPPLGVQALAPHPHQAHLSQPQHHHQYQAHPPPQHPSGLRMHPSGQ
ncbi:hypothetical protein PpBr36_01294 [Pyricularia pennisetigena]|uniref:hypothetical protein n=1 Tax=Pyricularia pennisetigena TaxID=1578925 RepID=UPI00114E3AA9|nr:hypothetical protein PpBr36_01294 [Pyricularia pennisetigena]TLS28477.1 hypothetical protein PpBr36_01294 [Pyricularia pennisetigena]